LYKAIKIYFLLFGTVLILSFPFCGMAALSGTYTINGSIAASATNYLTFTSALSDLNSGTRSDGGTVNGPGVSAAVIFNVSAGQTFHEAKLVLTTTGTAANTITFIKSGAGANPMIKAPYHSGTQFPSNSVTPYDAMFTLKGASYITINGIDLQDTGSYASPAGNTDQYRIESGYVLTNASTTVGSQYNNIKNCTIVLDSLNGASSGSSSVYGWTFGILSYISFGGPTAAGTNSYNNFDGNTISNVNMPIYIQGDASTHDVNNSIGVTIGNTITNWGTGVDMNSGNQSYGIWGNDEDNIIVANTTISNNKIHESASVQGIYFYNAVNGATIYSNKIYNINGHQDNWGSYINGIQSQAYGTISFHDNEIYNITTEPMNFVFGIDQQNSASSISIYNNYIHDITNADASTCTVCSTQPSVAAIWVEGSSASTQVYKNRIEGLHLTNTTSLGGGNIGAYTGFICAIYGQYSMARCDSNRFDNFTSVDNGNIYGYYGPPNSTSASFTRDTIYSFTHTGTGNVYGFYSGANTTYTYNYNVIHDLTGATGGIVEGINSTSSTATIIGNRIYTLVSNDNTSTGILVNGIDVSAGTTINLNNNMIGNLSAPSSVSTNAINGIYLGAGTTLNVYYNSVYLNASSSGANFGNSGIYTNTASTTIDMRDNLIVNKSTPSGTGLTVAHRRSGTAITNLGANTNYNNYNAGTPGAANLIYYDGTTSYQTLANYQAVVGLAPREANSLTVDPGFTSTTDLHQPNMTNSNPLISAGTPVPTVVIDIDLQPRCSPEIGADEWDFTGGAPPVSPITSTRPFVFCSSQTITFTGPSNQVTSWSWTFPGGTPATSTLQNPVVTYNVAGSYDVSLHTVNGCGFKDTTMTSYVTLCAGGGLSGTYTINPSAPASCSNFQTFRDANNALLCQTGAVTFNVISGQTFTESNILVTAAGTWPIVFQKSGILADPLITAGTTSPNVGTGARDGFFILQGTDSITFDGIDLQENAGNASNTTRMEWGYALLKNNGTDGCHSVVIKNCTITLNKVNTVTYGIYSNNINPGGVTQTVTNISGSNSNNQFFANTIQNSYNGILMWGYNDLVSPYNYYDQNNQIGKAGQGNTISNYGGVATQVNVIYTQYQNNFKIANNTINGAGSTTGITYGILSSNAFNSNVQINSNTITLAQTSTGQLYGINNIAGAPSGGGTGIVNIYSNTITLSNTGAAGATIWYGIWNTGGASGTVNIYSNTLQNFIVKTTGAFYLIYNTNNPASLSVYNNSITGLTTTATATAASFFINIACVPTTLLYVHNNTISGNTFAVGNVAVTLLSIGSASVTTGTWTINKNTLLTNTRSVSSTGNIFSINILGQAPVNSCDSNTISGISNSITTSTGNVYGINYAIAGPATATTSSFSSNTINNLSLANTGGGAVYGIIVNGVNPCYANHQIRLNTINTLHTAGSGNVYGIYAVTNNTGGNPVLTYQVSQNVIYNLYNAAAAGSTVYGMILNATGTASNTINAWNNMVDNLNSSASNTNAINGMYLTGGAGAGFVNAYYNSIYLNASSAGANFGTAGIYSDVGPTVTLKNNLVVNTSTPHGTGITVAHRRSTDNTFGTLTANNNGYYAGTAGASNLLYMGLTINDSASTITRYQTVSGKETNSISANPGFTSLTDLHQPFMTASSLVAGKGVALASITTDYDGDSRATSVPDLGYDEFDFTSLPIELLSFTGKNQGETNLLEWTTASEQNNDFFTVERSIDAQTFGILGKVEGAGNSSTAIHYSLVDESPYETAYYRLKQTDYNGNYTFSNSIQLTLKKGDDFSFNIYPNPSEGSSIKAQINAETGVPVLIILRDVLGRGIYSKLIPVSETNKNYCNIDPPYKLNPGVYFITATSDKKSLTKRLIIE